MACGKPITSQRFAGSIDGRKTHVAAFPSHASPQNHSTVVGQQFQYFAKLSLEGLADELGDLFQTLKIISDKRELTECGNDICWKARLSRISSACSRSRARRRRDSAICQRARRLPNSPLTPVKPVRLLSRRQLVLSGFRQHTDLT